MAEDISDLRSLVIKLLEQEASPEAIEIRNLIMRRVALESDIKPSRIPAPLNITEVGGYYNLLAKLNEETMLRQMLSSVLGLPMYYSRE
jgi:hypothetical protein